MCRVCVCFGVSRPVIWILGGPQMQQKTTQTYTKKWIKFYAVWFSTPGIWILVAAKKATKTTKKRHAQMLCLWRLWFSTPGIWIWWVTKGHQKGNKHYIYACLFVVDPQSPDFRRGKSKSMYNFIKNGARSRPLKSRFQAWRMITRHTINVCVSICRWPQNPVFRRAKSKSMYDFI